MTTPAHLAFVLEQTLGHVTHSVNLRAALPDDMTAQISWLPVEYHTTDRWRHLPLLSRNWTVTASLLAWRAVAALQQQGPIDAIFCHTHVPALGLLPLMGRLPVIVSLDATPLGFDEIGAAYGHRGGGLLAAPKHQLSRRVFQQAAGLVTWSAWVKRSLVADYGIPGERVTVIPPGTDLSLWATERAPAAADRPVRLLFVGGDFVRKGGADLLAACEPLLPDRCELHLVTRTAVPSRAGVTVHSQVTPNSEAMRQLYRMADVFVLPSYAEGLPMAIMEALAAGLPVISTPVAAIPEAVEPEVNGYLVPPGAIGDLRAAITRLIDEPERRWALGQAARRTAEERFDAHANARHIRHLLLAALATRRGGGVPLSVG